MSEKKPVAFGFQYIKVQEGPQIISEFGKQKFFLCWVEI